LYALAYGQDVALELSRPDSTALIREIEIERVLRQHAVCALAVKSRAGLRNPRCFRQR
jgi:hypothetical protein